MPITQDQVLTFLGGGLVVFVLEQTFQYFGSEKRVLGYAVDSRVLVEKSHADLKISYKGMDVEKVLSHSVRIRNIGNASLKDFPVYIQSSGGKFYFANIASKPGIECKKIDTAPCFAFTVNLLNPGDEVTVDLTILDAPDISLVVDARAEKLRVKNISGSYSTADALDVVLESSSGIIWTFAKVMKLALKK
jgi:hypothetical protein